MYTSYLYKCSLLYYVSSGSLVVNLSGEAYRNFIHSISSPYSRSMYIHIIKNYMAYRMVSDIDDLLNKDPKLLQSHIIDYLIDLKTTRNLSPKSRRLYATALRHFYDMNDITLNWKKITSFIGDNYKTVNDRPYTHEEIKNMLDKASERDRVIIFLMCSSGMREGAVHTLQLGDLKRIDKYNLYQITVYRNSSDQYTTFSSPECAVAIDNYLDYRKRFGERLFYDQYTGKWEPKQSPLIREQFDKSDTFACANPRSVTMKTISYIIYKLIYDAGLRQKKVSLEGQHKKVGERHEVMQSHGLRKFFDTQATLAGMSPLYVSILMGHKNGLETSYFKPTLNDLLDGSDKMLGYVGITDAITIAEENKLRREVEHYKVKASQFDSLKAEIDQLKELINK
jgi:integrase